MDLKFQSFIGRYWINQEPERRNQDKRQKEKDKSEIKNKEKVKTRNNIIRENYFKPFYSFRSYSPGQSPRQIILLFGQHVWLYPLHE